MWIRMRFDIGWLDFVFGLLYCILPHRRSVAENKARLAWNSQDDYLITLSVRSAFDLTLRALQLPRGSEVLMSALTVPDMVRIVQLHGLIPVPVDTDESGYVNAVSLRQTISPQTRVIVVAHLFGGSVPVDEILAISKDNDIFIIEDCAQSFRRVGDSGHPQTDVAMFSFGPIKTATALGGAIVRIKSARLRKVMRALLENDPKQTRSAFALRLARFAVLKMLSGKHTAAVMKNFAEWLGYDFDLLANSSARGFASANLLPQLRRKPSAPLLRLLGRRWLKYDLARIEKRVYQGRLLDSRIGLKHATSHSFWVYPILVHDPIAVRNRFRAAGFDATCQTRMIVVPAMEGFNPASSANLIWNHILFLPWYPDMPREAIEQMARLLHHFEIESDSRDPLLGLNSSTAGW